jgi:hypothetical protein
MDTAIKDTLDNTPYGNYISYTTSTGQRCRAVVFDTRVELYELGKDTWSNPYWRFILPISKEHFERVLKGVVNQLQLIDRVKKA